MYSKYLFSENNKSNFLNLFLQRSKNENKNMKFNKTKIINNETINPSFIYDTTSFAIIVLSTVLFGSYIVLIFVKLNCDDDPKLHV
jgi:hypothetical protein